MESIQLVNQGLELLAQGQLERAYQICERLLAEPSPDSNAFYLASEIRLAQYKLDEALEFIENAIILNPKTIKLHFKKAEIQLILRQGLNAQQTAKSISQLELNNPNLQLQVAMIFTQCDNHQGAENFLLAANEEGLSSQHFLFELAKNQLYLGKIESAQHVINRYLQLHPRNDGQIHLLNAQLTKQSKAINHVAQLRQQLTISRQPQEKVYLYFALAKELEDLRDYAASFEALSTGAKYQRSLLNYNLANELNNLDSLIQTFQSENFNNIVSSDITESPIFIVGMPRTGTTLVERIISLHKGVKSAGETSDFTISMSSVINEYLQIHQSKQLSPLMAALEIDYSKIGRKYLANMRNMIGEAERSIDKLPFNFLYCGLIKKAFPNARIIHLVRDPIDTCYAIFKTLFNQTYLFSYDLEELAEYYITYNRLMKHWNQLMPESILNVSYEDLVADPRSISKKITDFCRLDWSEALTDIENAKSASSTASAAQIRQPIYTSSVKNWENYALQLKPLIDKLAKANLIEKIN